jgi:hypothetical protein
LDMTFSSCWRENVLGLLEFPECRPVGRIENRFCKRAPRD